MTLSLVLGGARSGKSSYAQRWAMSESDSPFYVATSRPVDADHEARIERHRRERGPCWTTVEADTDLTKIPLANETAVVDCVTLWMSNFFADKGSEVEPALKWAESQIDTLATRPGHLIFVSNELGQGLHASTQIGRRFTDLQGFINQFLAARADSVVLMVAGLPLAVKGRLPNFG